MPVFEYKPYYKYNGPTKSDPFREEKTPDEVTRCLEFFFSELPNQFSDLVFNITRNGDIFSIDVDVAEKECDKRVAKCLNDNDLYAQKLKNSL